MLARRGIFVKAVKSGALTGVVQRGGAGWGVSLTITIFDGNVLGGGTPSGKSNAKKIEYVSALCRYTADGVQYGSRA